MIKKSVILVCLRTSRIVTLSPFLEIATSAIAWASSSDELREGVVSPEVNSDGGTPDSYRTVQ